MRCSATHAIAACLALMATASDAMLDGTLTTWVSVSATPLDGSCEFMKNPINSTTNPMLATYLRQGMHCSIGQNSPAYANGEACGACYKVKSTSDQGWSGDSPVLGAASEAIVMVSTGGITGTGRFDCFPEAFAAITGASTGEFAIEFEEAECDAIQKAPSVTNFGEKNAYYCKMVFNNIGQWGTLSSVEACLGEGRSNCLEMVRLSGQAWQNCPVGESDKITFFLTQQDPSGQDDTVDCICQGDWPWEFGDSCTCGVNFGRVTLSDTGTTTTITSASRAPDGSGDGGEGTEVETAAGTQAGSEGSEADGSSGGTSSTGLESSTATAARSGATAAAVVALVLLPVAQQR